MGMREYESAVKMIASQPRKGRFAGARPQSLIEAAERALGVHFPPTYRRFLMEYGAGNYGAAEIYGAIDEDFEDSSVPDGIWFTLSERRESELPPQYVVVADAGDGGLYCLDTSHPDAAGEVPVVWLESGAEPQVEEVSPDFGTFLLKAFEAQV